MPSPKTLGVQRQPSKKLPLPSLDHHLSPPTSPTSVDVAEVVISEADPAPADRGDLASSPPDAEAEEPTYMYGTDSGEEEDLFLPLPLSEPEPEQELVPSTSPAAMPGRPPPQTDGEAAKAQVRGAVSMALSKRVLEILDSSMKHAGDVEQSTATGFHAGVGLVQVRGRDTAFPWASAAILPKTDTVAL